MENSRQASEKLKIVFMGTPEFGALVLERLCRAGLKPFLVVTATDKPAGRKQIITPPPVKILAAKYGIDVLQSEKIQDAIHKIQDSSPDLIILVAYGQIIPKEILELPKYGSLNIHPSLLPKYRGPSPIQNAIFNGDEETGITIIKMTERIDVGPIVARGKLKIKNKKVTYGELLKELAEFGADLIIQTIPQWIEGKIVPEAQDETKATYTRIIKKEDGKIDWSQSAKIIEKQVRAFNPWPGAYSFMDFNGAKKQIKIIKADVLSQTKNGPFGSSGKTFLAPNDKIAVQTGKDFLIVEELQIEGKKKITSGEFIRGYLKLLGNVLY